MNGAMDPSLGRSNDCGCCEDLTTQTPVEIENRAGLTAIAYRVGTHARFKQSMLTRLSAGGLGLRTRDGDDFSIALLDAWATVSDVLTFYQERIANECYLRTATERRSLLEQARLIGYELRPGVAASTYLAFTLDEAPGAPDQATKQTTIDIGTKVQSIPGLDEKPQTFETIDKIEARVEWNAMKPQLVAPPDTRAGSRHLYLRGSATQLQQGDAILIVGDERDQHPTQHPDKERWDVRVLQSVTVNAQKNWTLVTWEEPLGKAAIKPAERNIQVFAFRQRAALFGHNAPDPRLITVPTSQQSVLLDKDQWKDFTIQGSIIDLDASYPKIVAGSWVALARPPDKLGERGYIELYKATQVSHPSRAHFGLGGKITRIQPDTAEHLAQDFFPLRDTLVFAQSEKMELAEAPLTLVTGTPSEHLKLDDGVLTPVEGNRITLDRVVAGLEKGRTLAVSGKLLRARIADTDRKNPLTLDSVDGQKQQPLKPGEILQIVELPSFDAATGKVTWHLKESEGFDGFVTTKPAQIVLTAAATDDEVVSEVLVVQDASGDPTALTLQSPGNDNRALKNKYDRATVTIFANVAAATHGETVQETLGGGDASQSYQKFTLRQPPLTYVSASTPSGAESTLQLRVNDLLWHEVQTFYERGLNERIFVTQTDDDGKTTVQFGDGLTGARPSTGQENVRATYRKGIGVEGNVAAGQLSTLLTRPLGLKAVTNPQAASGGDDRDSLDDARQNAPLTVLTLDRTVSLQDYEDFARAFAGVAKARATWTWDGRTHGVFVTVAGPDGAEVTSDSATYQHLLAAMQDAGDPFVRLRVKSYRKAYFRFAGTVKVNPDFEDVKVLAKVEQALRTQFSFDARAFGQPVHLSEVIAVIQAVPGVAAVDVDKLYCTAPPDETPTLHNRLLAALPTAGADGGVEAAELLTLDPAPLDALGVMS